VHDVDAFLLDDGVEVADVAEEDGDVVLGLLEFVLAVLDVFVHEFGD
jgi:hypothetical protein